MTSGIEDLVGRLRPLVFRLYDVVRRQAPQQQLSLTQGSVLRALVQLGPQRMGALAEAEGVRMPSMTDVVRRMERAGMVYREPDPVDRRATIVHLTPSGRRYFDDLVTSRDRFLLGRLSELDAADRAAIAAALPALERLLGKDGTAGTGNG